MDVILPVIGLSVVAAAVVVVTVLTRNAGGPRLDQVARLLQLELKVGRYYKTRYASGYVGGSRVMVQSYRKGRLWLVDVPLQRAMFAFALLRRDSRRGWDEALPFGERVALDDPRLESAYVLRSKAADGARALLSTPAVVAALLGQPPLFYGVQSHAEQTELEPQGPTLRFTLRGGVTQRIEPSEVVAAVSQLVPVATALQSAPGSGAAGAITL